MNNRLEKITKKMQEIPIGKEIIDWANKNQVKIEFADQDVEGKFHADKEKITLGEGYSDIELMVALSHELRHAWQDKQVDLQKYKGNIYAEIIFRNFAEADAFSFHNSFAIVAFGISQNKEFLAKIDNSFVDVINDILGKDSNNSTVEILRSRLFSEYFTDEQSIRIGYEERYYEHLKNNLENFELLNDTLGHDEIISLDKSDLNHFGNTDFTKDSSNYFDSIDILSDTYIGFQFNGLDEIVLEYEKILKNDDIRKII